MRTTILLRARGLGRMPLLVLVLAITACSFRQPEARTTPQPPSVAKQFDSAWEQAGAETIGQPQSAPLWLNDQQVQFFETARVVRNDRGNMQVQPLPARWRTQLPIDILHVPPSPHRAELSGQPLAAVQPLQPITLTVQIADYSGPAQLYLYDAQQRLTSSVVFTASGQSDVVVQPRGALGPQWALVLADGELAGAWNNVLTLDATTAVRTGQPKIDMLYPRIRDFMAQDVVSYELNGATVRGYRSPDNPLLWLRDHVFQERGFRYFETDMTSLLDAFRVAQRPDGSFPDVVDYPERGVQAFRKDVEADLEYLFVQGVYESWQATGDDAWLRTNLDAMRRGLRYATSDPLRWDAEWGLVRRPYTIDMWDFSYGPTTISPDDGKPAPRHWIDDATVWGIFHGDNTGLAHALALMSKIELQVGDEELAWQWRDQSQAIMRRLNALSWNGNFYTHFVPLGPALDVPSVDTSAQLSLSNAYALNRDVLERKQGQAIVQTYFERRDFARAFAEWYSIDPPFPTGSYGLAGRPGENPGEYVNGGIMPLVGGELARGAFRYGYEPYAFDILRRYAELIDLTGETYLWYYPDGRPGISGPDTIGTDGWGSSAMLGALIEGAAGIEDRASGYRDLYLSPRWSATPDVSSATVVARYAASNAYVAYTWQRDANSLRLDLTGTAEQTYLRLMLPLELTSEQRAAISVQVGGETVPTNIEQVGQGRYIVVPLDTGDAEILVSW